MTGPVAEEALPVDRSAFLDAMRYVPGAVAVIATAASGERRGLAATAWCSLSADPPTLLVCINRGASAHPFVLAARAFSVNLLSPTQTEIVAIFSAQRALDGDARFAGDCWTTGVLGQPLFRGAPVSFECRLIDAHDHGSHTVMIGRVVGVESSGRDSALMYVGGAYAVADLLANPDGKPS